MKLATKYIPMKYLVGIFLVLSYISCADESKQADARRPPMIAKDSNIIKANPANPFAPVDVSPMDMSYFPSTYPFSKMSGEDRGLPKARVIYSRPHKQGRNIFGSLIKYGEPWRLGANEATEIEFFQPVQILNKKVSKGRYVLYCIPHENKWTLVLNSSLFAWGLRPDRTKDVETFDVEVKNAGQAVEYFTMVFEESTAGADLVIAWDTAVVRLPIQF